ncbi:hypothetical protein [Rhizobacter sp. OV335]|uniref:hypothetical protein n=1 Tax=Rhizobacter sp. OV335 TaxID=1500264 RepID=UPI000916D52C|nr:hypothetical protein [Rhizobacter sp. OV335]SHN40616.1 hypothetical protein SAMN02787076_06286 [Rhizobacter sp. OV335]
MTISILKAERFYPLGKPLPRPEETKSVVDAVQIRPGIWRKPDGTLETRGYETPKPTTKPAEPEPVKAEAAALGDGWIQCSADMPDVPEGCYELRMGSLARKAWTPKSAEKRWSLRRNITQKEAIAAHQYRLIPTEAA